MGHSEHIQINTGVFLFSVFYMYLPVGPLGPPQRIIICSRSVIETPEKKCQISSRIEYGKKS